MADVTAIILTKDEEKNLPDCLNSIRSFARRAVVIDSGSTDRTCEIAREMGAEVLVHPFENYARQFNWGVDAANMDRVEIAGSFGYHLRAESLINLGLLPGAFAGRVAFVGNTSKSGGKAFLLNRDLRDEMQATVARIDAVELANRDDFQKIFVEALKF